MQFLRDYWENVRTSYWFLPALMTALAMVAAVCAVRIDEAIGEKWVSNLGWIYTGSADGARQLLATVAGSMITVAGVVFSITVVALSLASSQFGPRLLQNFMRDRGNQFVLGTFIATYAYCLLVLRTVRGQDGGQFVPHIAVTLGVVFALCGVGVLIYFIHHAAVSMQAPIIIANVGKELCEGIERMFPEELTDDDACVQSSHGSAVAGLASGDAARHVGADDDGYLQSVDEKRLLRVAQKHNLQVRLLHRPGQFVVRGGALLAFAPADHHDDPPKEAFDDLRDAFLLGIQATPTHDIEFAVRQLVEVAVRALSPGTNDPFTAVSCVDYLGAALSRLAERKFPPLILADDRRMPRVQRYPVTFADICDTAIRQIRQYGRSSAAVVIRLLDMIAVVLAAAHRADDRAALLRQALYIRDAAESLPHAADRTIVDERYRKLIEEQNPEQAVTAGED